MRPVIGRPFGCWPRLPFGLRPLEDFAVISGVTTRDPFALPALVELFDRIGPVLCRASGSARRGRQPPPQRVTSQPDLRDPQRLPTAEARGSPQPHWPPPA